MVKVTVERNEMKLTIELADDFCLEGEEVGEDLIGMLRDCLKGCGYADSTIERVGLE